MQVGLSVLSGFIFSFIWAGMLLSAAKAYTKKGLTALKWLAACLVPFGGIVISVMVHKQLIAAARERGVTIKDKTLFLVLSGLVLPVLGVNVIALGILQSDLNRIYAKEDAQTNGVAV